eukprot:SAG22_NODE_1882_length_3378_cov_3.383959_2_plen_310_part_00
MFLCLSLRFHCAHIRPLPSANPSGKLTQAWVESADAVHSPGNPWFQPYQADGGAKPNGQRDDTGPSSVLFPFGFGLSCKYFAITVLAMPTGPSVWIKFSSLLSVRRNLHVPVNDAVPPVGRTDTHWKYSKPTLKAPTAAVNSSLAVNVTVLNSGAADGATVVQVYAGAPIGPHGLTRNERVLVGYTKLSVASQQKAVATVAVNTLDLGRYDPYAREWVVDRGDYTLFAQDCAGSRWDGYLVDVHPITNPPNPPNPPDPPVALPHQQQQQQRPGGQVGSVPRLSTSSSPGGPAWQGAGCTVMGSVTLTVV